MIWSEKIGDHDPLNLALYCTFVALSITETLRLILGQLLAGKVASADGMLCPVNIVIFEKKQKSPREYSISKVPKTFY